jgi:hypothetical protein
MPLLIIDFLCLLAAAGMIIYIVESAVDMALWPYIVMGSVSLALLISLAFTLKGGFIAELKRRFHAKII